MNHYLLKNVLKMFITYYLKLIVKANNDLNIKTQVLLFFYSCLNEIFSINEHTCVL